MGSLDTQSCAQAAAAAAPAPALQGSAAPDPLAARFSLGPILGVGGFATARVAVDRATGDRFACKSILKARVPACMDVSTEVQVLSHLEGHPAVPALAAAFDAADAAHIVMELAPGGCLVDLINARGRLPEAEAAPLVRALLEVVAYAHDLGVVHRDIKLDNLVLSGPAAAARGAPLKLIDWGGAAFWAPGALLTGAFGTSFYAAPETLGGGGYDERADVWSVGAVAYVLLSGRPPFGRGVAADGGEALPGDCEPDMSSGPWSAVSEEAKDAVRQMMAFCPGARPSAREALLHEWLRGAGWPAGCGDNEIVQRLRAAAAAPPLLRAAALITASRLSPDEARGLRDLFEAAGGGGGGGVTAAGLAAALERRGGDVAAAAAVVAELEALVAAADLDGDGALSFPEFAAALLPPARLAAPARAAEAFARLDADCDGEIRGGELALAMAAGAGGAAGGAAAAAGEDPCDGSSGVDFARFLDILSAAPPPSDCPSSACSDRCCRRASDASTLASCPSVCHPSAAAAAAPTACSASCSALSSLTSCSTAGGFAPCCSPGGGPYGAAAGAPAAAAAAGLVSLDSSSSGAGRRRACSSSWDPLLCGAGATSAQQCGCEGEAQREALDSDLSPWARSWAVMADAAAFAAPCTRPRRVSSFW